MAVELHAELLLDVLGLRCVLKPVFLLRVRWLLPPLLQDLLQRSELRKQAFDVLLEHSLFVLQDGLVLELWCITGYLEDIVDLMVASHQVLDGLASLQSCRVLDCLQLLLVQRRLLDYDLNLPFLILRLLPGAHL